LRAAWLGRGNPDDISEQNASLRKGLCLGPRVSSVVAIIRIVVRASVKGERACVL